MNTTKNHIKGSNKLYVLIHGLEGSRQDWLEKDGYTKGGNLTEMLNRCGKPWVAGDLYGHGEWKAVEKDFSTDNISDELWPTFIAKSRDSLISIIDNAVSDYGYKEMGIITYSGGIQIAVALLKENLPVPATQLIAAVPPPEKVYDDEYSLHNNLSVFENRKVYIAWGTEDQEIPREETVWFFNKIPGSKKILRTYPSGHSLPLDWVNDLRNHL